MMTFDRYLWGRAGLNGIFSTDDIDSLPERLRQRINPPLQILDGLY